jgi:hypothetical protein
MIQTDIRIFGYPLTSLNATYLAEQMQFMSEMLTCGSSPDLEYTTLSKDKTANCGIMIQLAENRMTVCICAIPDLPINHYTSYGPIMLLAGQSFM